MFCFRQPYLAGIFLMGSGAFVIPPMTNYSKAEASCSVRTSSPLNVFAFRTHAHSLGKFYGLFFKLLMPYGLHRTHILSLNVWSNAEDTL